MVLTADSGTTPSTPPALPAPTADVEVVARDLSLVGRRVVLPAVTIQALHRYSGFFVKGDETSLLEPIS